MGDKSRYHYGSCHLPTRTGQKGGKVFSFWLEIRSSVGRWSGGWKKDPKKLSCQKNYRFTGSSLDTVDDHLRPTGDSQMAQEQPDKGLPR